jgi:tetratricopeptide (TPR) repeat protein
MARVAWSAFSRIIALHGKGELSAALEAALAALELCEQIGEGRLATWVEPMLAVIAADLGNDALARTHAERGWTRARELDQLVLSGWALNALGYAAATRGDQAESLAWYEQHVALIRDAESAVIRNLTLASAAEGYCNAGRLAEALQLVDAAIATSQFGNAGHYCALGSRVRGRILAAQDKVGDALTAFDSAIAQFEALGSRLELARAKVQRAALQLAHGDAAQQQAARADVAAARAAFVAMGAVRDAALAERLLSA